VGIWGGRARVDGGGVSLANERPPRVEKTWHFRVDHPILYLLALQSIYLSIHL
jgi:hypothetical protein